MVEGEGQEGGLDHQNVVDRALLQQVDAEEGRLVRRRAEDVQKLRAAQIEHELRVDGQVGAEAERRGVILPVLGKLLAELDQLPV